MRFGFAASFAFTTFAFFAAAYNNYIHIFIS